MSDAETLLWAWAWESHMRYLHQMTTAIHDDVEKGKSIIMAIEEKLAYRTPGLNKPMGHIVLMRDEAERLVQAWRTLFGC